MSDSGAGLGTRRQVLPPEPPQTGALLTLCVGVVVIAALYVARDVLIPITLSVLLSFLLAPVVSGLKRLRLGRVPAVLLAVLLALGIILGVGATIGVQVANLGPNLPEYEATLQHKAGALRGSVGGLLTAVEQRVNRAAERTGAPAAHPPHGKPGTSENPVAVLVEPPTPSPVDLAVQYLGPVLAPVGTAVLVLIIAVFVLLQRDDLRDRMIRLFGSTDLHRTTLALNDTAQRLARYFLTQLGINAGFGFIIAGGLFAIGVPSPALWGLVAMLLRFVPYLGVPLASIAPILLAAAIEPGWAAAAWTAALFFGVEAVTGQAIEPAAYGHSTGLSPASVVVAAIFWTWIWGPIGLLLSTPLTLCLVVLGRHVERLEFLAVLLGDRPALTPVETLYQRLLAGDADEAATQADQWLRDRALPAYYDEVALPALQMAAFDAARGVLLPERQNLMRDAITGLVEDFEEHEDAVPETSPVNDVSGALLCIGGRTPIDDAVAAMLAQLMRRRGAQAAFAPHEAVSRDRIGTFDLGGVETICVSYMRATGTAAQLRFLLRRVRGRAPQARLVLGLWGSEETAPERLLGQVTGGLATASTLHEAAALCLRPVAAQVVQAVPAEAAGGARPPAAERDRKAAGSVA